MSRPREIFDCLALRLAEKDIALGVESLRVVAEAFRSVGKARRGKSGLTSTEELRREK